MALTYPKLAGFSENAAVPGIEPFIVGQNEIVTDSAPALANIAQYELCVLLDTGVRPYVTGDSALAPDKLVVSQLAVLSGQRAQYYTSGKFNHNMMIWPSAVNTYALRKSLVGNGPIQIGHAKPPSA